MEDTVFRFIRGPGRRIEKNGRNLAAASQNNIEFTGQEYEAGRQAVKI